MKIIDTIEQFISGDWGEEEYSEAMPCAVTCVRGADIVPIGNNDFTNIPKRGSPTQSTGRVTYVSKELIEAVGPVVCSNFCTAFRIKDGWNPLYIYYQLIHVYNSGIFFNFEGKTSGLRNLQLDAAFAAIPIEDVDIAIQDRAVAVLDKIQQKITLNRQINRNLAA